VWGTKITDLEEYVDFSTLDTEKLFNKLKSHELSHKCRPKHDASFSSKALITSGGHGANPTITVSSALEFFCPLWPSLLMSSTRASPTTILPY
jgi:hypothetical protein